MADAPAPKPKTAFGVVMTSKPAPAPAPVSQTSPRGGASAAKAPAQPAAAGKAPAKAAPKAGPAAAAKAPAGKPAPAPAAEGQLQSSIGVGKIASKFGKQDFAPPPEKPIKAKPKAAPPAGASTAASKAMFEQKMKEQKPTPKLGLQAAKFERKINAQTRAVEASKTKAPLPQRPAHSMAKQFEDGRATNTGATQKAAAVFVAGKQPATTSKVVNTGAGASPKDIASKLQAQAAANAAPVTSKPPAIVRSQEPTEEEHAPSHEEPAHHEAPAADEQPAHEEQPAAHEEEHGGEAAAGEHAASEGHSLLDANGNVVGTVSADSSTIYDAAGNLLCTMQGSVILDGSGGQLGNIGEDGHYYDSANTDLGHMNGNQAFNGNGELVGAFDGSRVTYSDDSLFGTADGVSVEAVAVFYFFFFAGGAAAQ